MSKTYPKITNIFLVLSLLFSLTGCFSKDSDNKDTTLSEQTVLTAESLTIDRNGLSKAKITLKTVYGNIVYKFYPKKAPNTVTRMIELVNSGFYDGLIFHRVVPNFVIQGGDPTGTGMGGSGKKLGAEFNDIQHIKGTVAMARAEDPNSADSQFYIVLTTLSHLDNNYTVFGQVVEGLELLNKVQKGDKILSASFEK